MISKIDIQKILENYDTSNLTIGVLGGHSALDVCSGAKRLGFRTVAVCQKGRDKTYSQYYRSRGNIGCVDEVILVDKFGDITENIVQEQLRSLNTLFVHNRYFWVYCDFEKIENNFNVPILGSRGLVKLEERDQPNNQYELLFKAGVQIPKIVKSGVEKNMEQIKNLLDEHFNNGGGPLIVKVNEAIRAYERAFFITTSIGNFVETSESMVKTGKITEEALYKAVIEEFIIGAQINFNYFYSPLTGELEIMGTDTRRQTSLDGFLRLDSETQLSLIASGYKPTMVETGHIACTTKESILEKAFVAGEKFVKTLQNEGMPIIGAFALQGAIDSRDGREDFIVFDVSMRIPGSPGTRFTPCTSYLYGESVSYGDRIAMEVVNARNYGRLSDILT